MEMVEEIKTKSKEMEERLGFSLFSLRMEKGALNLKYWRISEHGT